jgi:hypothetical protein
MELAQEAKDHFVGPMDPQAFLDEFLPFTGTPSTNAPDFTSVCNVNSEPAMYDPFVSRSYGILAIH